MSLIVTSSRQIEFNGLSVNGLEKPESYTNIMRSPLIIEAESEIAVVSIKCNRTGEFVVGERGLRFGIYWGTELNSPQFLNTDLTSATPVTPGDCILSKNRVVYILIPRGTYSRTGFITEIQNQINKIARETFSNFNECIVTANGDSAGTLLGLILEFKQNASATDVSAALETPLSCVTLDNQTPPEVIDETYTEGPYKISDDFVWNKGAKTLTAGSSADKDCIAVFDKALSSASGVIEVDFLASSGDITIGLVRAIDPFTACPMSFNQGTDEAGEPGNEYEAFYDYSFDIQRANVATVNRMNVAQAYSNAGDDVEATFMTIIDSASFTGGAPPALAKFQGVNEADTDRFHIVRFERFGERLKISVVNSKTAVTQVIADHTLSCLKPVNMASDKLYLKIEMLTSGDVMKINKYSCDSVGGYKDPRNYGFDDIVTNANQEGPDADPEIVRNVVRAFVEAQNRSVELDTAGAFANFSYFNPTDFEVAPTYKVLNASGGQDRNWVLVLAPSDFDDKPSYQTAPTGIPDDISSELGFTKKIIRETKDKDKALSTTNDIFFKSSRAGGLDGFQTASMFIRFHAGQQQSYNANTGSVSKIVYACPRFDINGSIDGPLYYEPNERVYIDMNNPSALTLTNMAIDIVDVNEQLIPNLDGQTQINFHIRKKSTGSART